MKKLLCAVALVPVLLGAGCAGSGSGTGSAGATDKTTIGWTDRGDGCVALLVSSPAAKALGYPDGTDDSLCASADTSAKLTTSVDKDFGAANVTMSNMTKESDHVYRVDILSVSDAR